MTELRDELARQLPDDVPWLCRPADDQDGHARLLVGDSLGAIRGVLDREHYSVRESDVPVREGWMTLLEISR